MSVVVYAEWVASPESDTKFKVELHKEGFSGTARKIDATGGYIDHNYQSLNPREPFRTPILKSDLTLEWMIRSDDDVDILEDVFNSNVGVYKLVKYVNDAVDWTANVAVDQLTYRRSPYPFSANVVARDMDDLDGVDYGLLVGRERIIKVIADILYLLGYDLDIRTYTRWKEGAMTDEQDFLNERYIEKSVLRTYGRGGEPDESISKYEALEMICRSFGLFLIQSENHWNIFQLTALENADDILEFIYTPDGTQIIVS